MKKRGSEIMIMIVVIIIIVIIAIFNRKIMIDNYANEKHNYDHNKIDYKKYLRDKYNDCTVTGTNIICSDYSILIK